MKNNMRFNNSDHQKTDHQKTDNSGYPGAAHAKNVHTKAINAKTIKKENIQAKNAPAQSEVRTKAAAADSASGQKCPYAGKCGGCSYTGIEYSRQLELKQKRAEELFGEFGKSDHIIGMEEPLHYRNKVHHVFSIDRKGNVITGCYEAGTHHVVNIEDCMIEDAKSREIISTIAGMLRSFKIRVYDEDRHDGLLRHVLVRRGFKSGEIMVVLVMASPVFPSKNNFVKALREKHPDITTIVQNINNADTSMVLGNVNKTLFGPGYIKDELCGNEFRISPSSFYQVNPVQTEKLYRTAVSYAGLTGKEKVIDAYCGIGTIGITAACAAGSVIGVELNGDAVKDAILNAKENAVKNIRFFKADASEFMEQAAAEGETADVIFMDPPRSGSTEKFMKAAAGMKPSRIVYVSCGPDTLKRDLRYFKKLNYRAVKIQPVDMFPFTEHVECVVLLSKRNAKLKDYVEISENAEDYYSVKRDRYLNKLISKRNKGMID